MSVMFDAGLVFYLICVGAEEQQVERYGGHEINDEPASEITDFIIRPRQHQHISARVMHSHWSRSVEILCSDLWNLTMLAPRSMP